MKQLEKLTLFYDGACPLCQAEILFLENRNVLGLLNFVDIHSRDFNPNEAGISCNQALASMYAQYESGQLIQGVEVFTQAYLRANLPFLSWIFSRSYLRPILDSSYCFFAKFRHQISKIFGPSALWLAKKSNKVD